MILIEAGKEIRLENVLSLRKKMTQEEINSEMLKIGNVLQDNGAKKAGPVVTATFAIETLNGQSVLDMEILIPLDKKIAVSDEYTQKPVFHIVNALYARHEGNPSTLQNTYNDMLAYINHNKLQQITAGYNVQVKDVLPGMTPDEMTIDVYIGITPNIL
ncbi:effector-binding domain-containing protein [Ruminiclostridium sufflavum DSM 19573]|uniref:Effector-binding domain-containing protein n=1 Tax=Ruminiclostridium sufflavum DSM 19573 TaxID=1121337 RepID=A0A318XJB7_9FIRM|nr:AraC family transcriptional regulator [Ruminiclostridium sufflavum]PYG86626.1 effector-binding domain-containing protein [Ruminiclostridium sufflavum DSM 19573]